jgi:hypothetical protein
VLRDLIEFQGGLEMDDRLYYTGFVNEQGHVIKGRAAKWKMADWLVEKLDECAEFGYVENQESSLVNESEKALLKQELGSNTSIVLDSSLLEGGERALLEQEDDEDLANLFDRDWIIEFRQSMPPMIGLIWAGSIENKQRETG